MEFYPDLVDISMAGFPISGFGPDSKISVEAEAETFGDAKGVDGDVTRIRMNESRATATITLMQSSPSNDVLTQLHNRDLRSPNGAGIGPFVLRDRSGTTVIRARRAWIQAWPTTDFGSEVGTREWQIRLADTQWHVGGN